jgi:hypothetical protein
VKPAPTIVWAILQYDPALKEKRLVDVYAKAEDANTDALALSNVDTQPTVEPFEIHNAAQYGGGEPVTESSDDDFDVPVQIMDEVR